MFAKSVCGADASALVYSITETALLNHLKPYAYLNYILDELRKKGGFSKEELKNCFHGQNNFRNTAGLN